jgi:hypothetical protein
VPALARLLGGGALAALHCIEADLRVDAPAAAALAAALRGSSTLTSLTLHSASMFHDAASGIALLRALTGHASLRVLSVWGNGTADVHQAAVGAALGALLAANAPALTALDVTLCDLGDDGMRPLFTALPANTHLRQLQCAYNDESEACARHVLLPAVRANASLRALGSPSFGTGIQRELLSRAQP